MFLAIIDYTWFLYSLWRVSAKNNENNVNRLITITKKCGTLAIKLLQFILMRDTSISNEKLCFVFENCENHSFEYTKELYFKEFHRSIYDDYIIIDTKPIASGSIGQVYKVYSKKRNEYIAMKVKHPNVDTDISSFINVIKIVCMITYSFNKYNSIILEFIDNIHKQLNYTEEAKNTNRLKELWNSEKTIIVPEVFHYTNSIMCMTYHEGQNYNSLSDHTKLIVSLYMTFIFYTSFMVHDFFHADLHTGNWKVIIHNDGSIQIILYDCGIMCTTGDMHFNKAIMVNVFNGTFEKILYLVSKKQFNNVKLQEKHDWKVKKCEFFLTEHLPENSSDRLRFFIDTVLNWKLFSDKNSIHFLNAFAIIGEVTEPSSVKIIKYQTRDDPIEILIFIFIGLLEKINKFEELKIYFTDWMNSDPKNYEVYTDWLFEKFGHRKKGILDTIIYKVFK